MKTFRRLLSFIIGIITFILMPIIVTGYLLFGIIMAIYYVGVGVHKRAYDKVVGKK